MTSVYNDDYTSIIREEADAEGVDSDLMLALADTESGRNPYDAGGLVKSSPAGARGLFQIMPVHNVDSSDPRASARYAARLIKSHLAAYDGDLDKALAAYNAGPGNVAKYGGVPPFAETQAHIARTRANLAKLKGEQVGGHAVPPDQFVTGGRGRTAPDVNPPQQQQSRRRGRVVDLDEGYDVDPYRPPVAPTSGPTTTAAATKPAIQNQPRRGGLLSPTVQRPAVTGPARPPVPEGTIGGDPYPALSLEQAKTMLGQSEQQLRLLEDGYRTTVRGNPNITPRGDTLIRQQMEEVRKRTESLRQIVSIKSGIERRYGGLKDERSWWERALEYRGTTPVDESGLPAFDFQAIAPYTPEIVGIGGSTAMLGPTLIPGMTAGGAAAGSVLGPPGTLAGAGLGFGAGLFFTVAPGMMAATAARHIGGRFGVLEPPSPNPRPVEPGIEQAFWDFEKSALDPLTTSPMFPMAVPPGRLSRALAAMAQLAVNAEPWEVAGIVKMTKEARRAAELGELLNPSELTARMRSEAGTSGAATPREAASDIGQAYKADVLAQATQDWQDGRLYMDGAGNWHLRPESPEGQPLKKKGPVAEYNDTLKVGGWTPEKLQQETEARTLFQSQNPAMQSPNVTGQAQPAPAGARRRFSDVATAYQQNRADIEAKERLMRVAGLNPSGMVDAASPNAVRILATDPNMPMMPDDLQAMYQRRADLQREAAVALVRDTILRFPDETVIPQARLAQSLQDALMKELQERAGDDTDLVRTLLDSGRLDQAAVFRVGYTMHQDLMPEVAGSPAAGQQVEGVALALAGGDMRGPRFTRELYETAIRETGLDEKQVKEAMTVADRVAAQIARHMGGMTPEAVYPYILAGVQRQSAEAGEALYQTAANNAAIWYHQTLRALATHRDANATVAQVRALLSPKNGVRAEELKWTGVAEWLDLKQPSEMVTLAEVRQRIAEGQPALADMPPVEGATPLFQQSELLAPHPGTPFFSQLGRTLDTLTTQFPKGTTIERMLSLLSPQKSGVKLDEMHWSGMGEWLQQMKEERGANGRVTPEEWAAAFQQRRVALSEQWLGVPQQTPQNMKAIEDFRQQLTDLEQERRELARDIREAERNNDYEEVNYLRNSQQQVIADAQYINNEIALLENGPDARYNWTSTKLPNGTRYREWLLNLAGYTNPGPNHFGEDNLAHARVQDMTSPDGVVSIHAGEFQADPLQQGRREGFRTAPLATQTMTATNMGGYWEVRAADGTFITNAMEHEGFRTAEEAIAEARRRIGDPLRSGRDPLPPPAPLSTTWHETAFRRMLYEAAATGMDRLTWSTGDEQLDRWKTNAVAWQKNDDGSFEVAINALLDPSEARTQGRTPEDWIASWNNYGAGQHANIITVRSLDDIPRDAGAWGVNEQSEAETLQKRLWAKMNAGAEGVWMPRKEGMEEFYDRQLTGYASRFIKKWPGAEVKQFEVVTEPSKQRWGLLLDGQPHHGRYGDAQAADDEAYFIRRVTPNVKIEVVQLDSVPAKTQSVWGVDITPEMRAGLQDERVALFQKLAEGMGGNEGNAKGMTQFLDDGRALVTIFETGDVSTIMHEMAHVWRRYLPDEDLEIAASFAGASSPRIWGVEAEERFARAFERWLYDGTAPSPELVRTFESFRQWLTDIYKTVTGSGIDVNLTPEIRGVFDRMLGVRSAQEEARIAAGYTPQEAAAIGGQVRRGFAESILASDIDEMFREMVEQDPSGYYTPINNRQTLEDAVAAIHNDPQKAVRAVRDKEGMADAQTLATAMLLIRKSEKEGDYDAASDLAMDFAERLTKAGQFIQAASMWSRLDPDNILNLAARVKLAAISGSTLRINTTPEENYALVRLARTRLEDTGGRTTPDDALALIKEASPGAAQWLDPKNAKAIVERIYKQAKAFMPPQMPEAVNLNRVTIDRGNVKVHLDFDDETDALLFRLGELLDEEEAVTQSRFAQADMGQRYPNLGGELPPMGRLPETGTYAAVRASDGSIYFATDDKTPHISIIRDQNIPADKIRDGGYIRDGVYYRSASDAIPFGEGARKALREQQKNDQSLYQADRAPAPAPDVMAPDRAALRDALLRQLQAKGINEETARTRAQAKRTEILNVTDKLNAAPGSPEEKLREATRAGVRVRTPGVTSAVGPTTGQTYQFSYRLMSLDELITSHINPENPTPNPAFDQRFQPRDRDAFASRAQITSIATAPRTDEFLHDSRSLDRGPMIVGPDRLVESGNGRTLGLLYARNQGLPGWQQYQQALSDYLSDYGLDPRQLQTMKDAVLVRVRTTPLSDADRMAFVKEANENTVMQASMMEQARGDAGRLPDTALAGMQIRDGQTLADALADPSNVNLRNEYFRRIPPNEMNALVDAQGNMTTAGVRRMTAALFMRVYPGEAGERLFRNFLESTEDSIKRVQAGLFGSLPAMARLQSLIIIGDRPAELSLAEDLSKAADVLARLKARRQTVERYLQQGAMFGQELTDEQKKILIHLEDLGSSGARVREFVEAYTRQAEGAESTNPRISNVQASFDIGQPIGGQSSTDLLSIKSEFLSKAMQETAIVDSTAAGARRTAAATTQPRRTPEERLAAATAERERLAAVAAQHEAEVAVVRTVLEGAVADAKAARDAATAARRRAALTTVEADVRAEAQDAQARADAARRAAVEARQQAQATPRGARSEMARLATQAERYAGTAEREAKTAFERIDRSILEEVNKRVVEQGKAEAVARKAELARRDAEQAARALDDRKVVRLARKRLREESEADAIIVRDAERARKKSEAELKRLDANLDSFLRETARREVSQGRQDEQRAIRQQKRQEMEAERDLQRRVNAEANEIERDARTSERIAKRDLARAEREEMRLNGELSPRAVTPSNAQRAVEDAMDVTKHADATRIPAATQIKLRKQAAELKALPPGRDRTLKSALLMRDVYELAPPSWGKIISTTQVLAQLLNVMTATKNITGNALFFGFDNTAKVLQTGIDMAASLATGQRSSDGIHAGKQAKGLMKGFREGMQEALLGINLQANPGKVERYGRTRAFRYGFSDVMEPGITLKERAKRAMIAPSHYGEIALNLSLQVPDRMFYQAAYDAGIAEQAQLAARNNPKLKTGAERSAEAAAKFIKPDASMQEIAHLQALYRTFQNETQLSRMAVGLKEALNNITIVPGTAESTRSVSGKGGGQVNEFGLGNLIINYPRVPANLTMAAVDYSPLGFLRVAYDVGVIASRLKSGQEMPEMQAKLTGDLSRAIMGTFFLGAPAYVLATAGLLTGRLDRDPDVRDMERQAGVQPYSINLSGVVRWIGGGFRPEDAKRQAGDTFMTYDWALPLSATVAGAAEFAKGRQRSAKLQDRTRTPYQSDFWMQVAANSLDAVTAGGEALFLGMDIVADQPMLRSMREFFGTYSPAEAMLSTLVEAPAQFVPTIVAQMARVADNTVRETRAGSIAMADYGGSDLGAEMYNKVLAKIPFLSATLPPKYNTMGETVERLQTDKRNGAQLLWDSLANPARFSEYMPKPEAELYLKLYEQTGQKGSFPRVTGRTVQYNDLSFPLTAEEIGEYQRKTGTRVKEATGYFMATDAFKKATPKEQVELIQRTLLPEINRIAEAELIAFSQEQAKARGDFSIAGQITPLPDVVKKARTGQLEDDSDLDNNRISGKIWVERYNARNRGLREFFTTDAERTAGKAATEIEIAIGRTVANSLKTATNPGERKALLVSGYHAIPMNDKADGTPNFTEFRDAQMNYVSRLNDTDKTLLQRGLSEGRTPTVGEWIAAQAVLRRYWDIEDEVLKDNPVLASAQPIFEWVRSFPVGSDERTRAEGHGAWKSFRKSVSNYRKRLLNTDSEVQAAGRKWLGVDLRRQAQEEGLTLDNLGAPAFMQPPQPAGVR